MWELAVGVVGVGSIGVSGGDGIVGMAGAGWDGAGAVFLVRIFREEHADSVRWQGCPAAVSSAGHESWCWLGPRFRLPGPSHCADVVRGADAMVVRGRGGESGIQLGRVRLRWNR